MRHSAIARHARAALPGRTAAALTCLTLLSAAACGDDNPVEPGVTPGDLLVVTSIPDQTGQSGSSFIQTASLDQAELTNASAFEQTFYPYAAVHGSDVIVTQHFYGDQAVRYVRGADGRLTETGRMNLPPASFSANVVYASPTKAYLSLIYGGKILVINPQTMTQTGEIDLTALGIARNPSNPADRNPNPAVMRIRDGKLFVGLQQLVNEFTSANGVDIAIIDVATDQFEKVIHDPRAASPGRYGYNQTMFVDEQGDLYVSCIGSWGFAPGQKAGLLRIRSGETEFDPTYFVNVTDASVAVPGGRLGFFNSVSYGGNGYLYALAHVPALQSNPPQYAVDRDFQPVRVHLPSGQIELLPLPRTNGVAAGGVTVHAGKVIFGYLFSAYRAG